MHLPMVDAIEYRSKYPVQADMIFLLSCYTTCVGSESHNNFSDKAIGQSAQKQDFTTLSHGAIYTTKEEAWGVRRI